MFAGFGTKRRRRRNNTTSNQYTPLESRRVLTMILPEMTTDVAAYADSVDDAIIRVDDQQRLIIRTTGTENEVVLNLRFGYLQVNESNTFSSALQIDPSQYNRILLVGDGEDSIRVFGSDLRAQLFPDRTWVRSESTGSLLGDPSTINVNASGFENVEVSEPVTGDVGPFFVRSNNRIRISGSDGVDRLRMESTGDFAIGTRATLSGDGYTLTANSFGDLFVSGGGGNDFATLVGTRGFESGAFFPADGGNGSDLYFGQDSFSRITNDMWEGRFLDFEVQRIDLLSGSDQSIVEDTILESTFYRVDGNDLVGAFRRMINVEDIEIVGDIDSVDSLRRPDAGGTLEESPDEFVYSGEFVRDDSSDDSDSSIVVDSVPDFFVMTFRAFERLLG